MKNMNIYLSMNMYCRRGRVWLLQIVLLGMLGGFLRSSQLQAAASGSIKAWGCVYSNVGGGWWRNDAHSIPFSVSDPTSVTAIAVSRLFSLALLADGTVKACGSNTYGQLGDGTTDDRSTPVTVSGLSGVTAIAAGEDFSLALLTDGTVKAWGYNEYGQLGDGTTTNRSTPVTVLNLSGVTAIAAGQWFSLALLTNGTVKAWGYNKYGQLGDGTTTNRSTPATVPGLSDVTAIAVRGHFSLALLTDGTVKAWGSNAYGQLGDGTTIGRNTPVTVSGLSGVTAIAVGNMHSLTLLSDGTVRAWGYNEYGQLGDGTATDHYIPMPVADLSGVVAVAAGADHSLALLTDGTVKAWGSNRYGQLGDGTQNFSWTPVTVQGLAGAFAIAAGNQQSRALIPAGPEPAPTVLVAASDDSACALGSDIGVFTVTRTGSTASPLTVQFTFSGTAAADDYQASNIAQVIIPAYEISAKITITPLDSRLGASDTTVVLSLTPGPTYKLGAASQATVTIYAGRSPVWGLGYDVFGQLGDGGGDFRFVPVSAYGLSGVTALAGGDTHSLALLQNGTVKACGSNIDGELGDGTSLNRSTPITVPGLSAVAAISAGNNFSLALLSDGTVQSWGNNSFGQLGDGTRRTRYSPVAVSGLTGVTAVSGGFCYSLALLADGTVKSWGYSAWGKLGYGTDENYQLTPRSIDGLSSVVAVAAGTDHSLALLADGTVKAWGRNDMGQLGDSTTTDCHLTPVTVGGLSGVVSIAASEGWHSLALLADGTVKAWGYNAWGQLGDGTTIDRNTPVTVAGLSGVTAIAVGHAHSLALLSDGTVKVWGGSGYGQQDDGTTSDQTIPQTISGLRGAYALAAGNGFSLIAASEAPLVKVTASDAQASESGPDTGTFTVTRTGSTAAALVVNLALSGTADSADYNSSDYNTVTIPSGSSTAAVTITPIADGVAEDDETVILTLASASDYFVDSSAGSATVTIADNDSSSTDPVTQFVTRFYQCCLQRSPDTSGLNSWVSNLKSGVSTGADVGSGFVFGVEFQGRNLSNSAWLDVLYQVFFNRAADTAGKNGWLAQMGSGTSKLAVLEGFTKGQEFVDLCDQYGITPYSGYSNPVKSFVMRFYRLCLQREPDTAGLNSWVSNLQNGYSTGADMATGFVFSAEFQARSLADDAFLDVLYQAVFGRAADAAGKNGWLEQLSAGTSRQIVVAGFIHGAEFSAICNQYGIKAY